MDGPAVEIGIAPPGGAEPVLFGRPAPATLLLVLMVQLLPTAPPGNDVLALTVDEELDSGKGIVGKFGILLPTLWLAGPFGPPGPAFPAFEFWPRVPP